MTSIPYPMIRFRSFVLRLLKGYGYARYMVNNWILYTMFGFYSLFEDQQWEWICSQLMFSLLDWLSTLCAKLNVQNLWLPTAFLTTSHVIVCETSTVWRILGFQKYGPAPRGYFCPKEDKKLRTWISCGTYFFITVFPKWLYE